MDSIPEEDEEETLTESTNDIDDDDIFAFPDDELLIQLADRNVPLGLDQIDIFDGNNEEMMMQEESGTEEEEADSHPELGEGDLLPIRAELPLRVSGIERKRRSKRTKWNEDLERKRMKRSGSILSEIGCGPPRKKLKLTRKSNEL